MEPNISTNPIQVKASAKDFFLHLGAIVALYTVVISFLNLMFKVINKAFPEVQRYYSWSGGSEISMSVATLIVVFPIFIILSWLVHKIYIENPAKKELSIRKWLTYITLFVAGIILAGDLVTVLYKFLDGQDLTVAFLLKALIVFIVAGCVFGFYLQDIRDRVSSKGRKVWASAIALVILVSIVLGFGVLGSPRSQRLIRLDNQKITDLQQIQWQVINYWQVNGFIPENLPNMMIDSETGAPYKYRKIDNLVFELCADFNHKNIKNYASEDPRTNYPSQVKIGLIQNDNWDHGAGTQCFTKTIDPIAYPTEVRG